MLQIKSSFSVSINNEMLYYLVLVEMGREVSQCVTNITELGDLGRAEVSTGARSKCHIVKPSRRHCVLEHTFISAIIKRKHCEFICLQQI